jgi:hypothetical protein
MENNSLFQSKYDNEFIGLLNEIGIRLQKFDKCDTLKIKSWINILMMPCKSNVDKKNRNLYAILLINQMVNGKLEEPFVKFANNTSDLKQLSPANIKSELTKKFYEEIDFEKIENFGYAQQKQFIQNHPQIAEQIREKEVNKINPDNKTNKKGNNFSDNNNVNKNNNKKVVDYSRVKNIINYNVVDPEFRSQKAYFNKPFGIFNEQDYDKLMEVDINNLYSIIQDLEQKINERDIIIEQQNDKIDELKKVMMNYEKSLK